MLQVVDVQAIRSMHARGWSQRRIARELGLSRETVAKYVGAEEVQPRYRMRKARPAPVLEEVRPLIDQWLRDDEQAPRKQRHTAHRIWERLRSEPYEFGIGESTVRRYVRQARNKVAEAFLPLEFALGHAEVDWGEAEAVIGGQRESGIFFAMRLDGSQDALVQMFPTQKMETVYEEHRRAFEYFGGVPWQILYDNPRTLVARVGRGRQREEQPGFLALRAHYGFEAHFCMPGQEGAHEKGGIENMVGFARRNFLVPVPEAPSWDAANEQLWQQCLQRRERRHSREAGTIGDVFAREREHLLPLPAHPFPCCRVASATVDRHSRITCESNRYSVPTRLVGHVLNVKLYWDRIEVVDGEQVVATHPRLHGTGQESLQIEHYLDLLARKPSAVADTRVLRSLGEPFATLRARCVAQVPPANRDFIGILRLCGEFPTDVVAQAVTQALEAGIYRVDAVRQLCFRAMPDNTPPPPLEREGLPALACTPDLSVYDLLLAAGRKR